MLDPAVALYSVVVGSIVALDSVLLVSHAVSASVMRCTKVPHNAIVLNDDVVLCAGQLHRAADLLDVDRALRRAIGVRIADHGRAVHAYAHAANLLIVVSLIFALPVAVVVLSA